MQPFLPLNLRFLMPSLQLIPPQQIKTEITLPASKSICNRALIIAALCKNKISIKNASESDDTLLLQAALESEKAHFDVGAAGTAMRFLTAYLAQKEGNWTITGSRRMKERPIGVLVEALRQLGADIAYVENDGYPPLQIRGKKLTGGKLSLPSHVSSQFISAILMIAPTLRNGLTLTLDGDIISRPYIEMTLDLMAYFGVKSSWKEHCIHVPEEQYVAHPFEVEMDWSGASYWYEIAALAPYSEISLKNARKKSYQGDAAVRHMFRELGVSTSFTPKGALLKNTGQTTDFFTWNLAGQPDLAQTLVTTCAMLAIPFRISGLQTLRIKETDRIEALIKELSKYGIAIGESGKGILEWHGECGKKNTQINISTYDDHRMALAFAPTALLHPGICIEDPQVVSKSYPHFWSDLKKAGFKMI